MNGFSSLLSVLLTASIYHEKTQSCSIFTGCVCCSCSVSKYCQICNPIPPAWWVDNVSCPLCLHQSFLMWWELCSVLWLLRSCYEWKEPPSKHPCCLVPEYQPSLIPSLLYLPTNPGPLTFVLLATLKIQEASACLPLVLKLNCPPVPSICPSN